MTDIVVNAYTQEIHATPVGANEIVVSQPSIVEILVEPWRDPEIGEGITNLPTIIVSSVSFPDIEILPATASISVINAGPQGPAGPPGEGGGETFRYVHTQAVADDVWIVDHYLGGYPNVTVVEDGTNETVIGDVVYISQDRLEISFSTIRSGKAYLS